MVLLKIFGAMDLATVVMMLLLQFDFIGWRKGFVFAAYLIFKGIYFMGDVSSALDLICGVYMIAMCIGLKTWIAYMVMLYLAQKIYFSMSM
ncbi:hypothetical protein COV93_01740 [Candidatus Woesearchaeota archaeon CG11_big_fil_rev_8_21_14_0_20_43_8]|nr:MAG: hypothetical protein COV93_01740 [Candidatus Woesearchaeota archaeon CG11_big_fil_rev_8_21_14_0_20_43_8]PIO05109.1 MAG: hypothetical protein COT47_06225 [Candidatus Woesearchaeota archaeon CG08_land_8_20_14_0_20_43_7]